MDGIRRNLERTGKVDAIVNVGLRTAVWNPEGGPLLHAFNAITRKVAITRNMTLFDLDNDVWGAVGWNYTRHNEIMRDYIHPSRYRNDFPPNILCADVCFCGCCFLYVIKRHFLTLAAEKMLGYVYTSCLSMRGAIPEAYGVQKVWIGGPQPMIARKVRFVRKKEQRLDDLRNDYLYDDNWSLLAVTSTDFQNA